MHEQGFFWYAFVYLTAAVVSVPIAKRFGLGSVLGYLIAGMVIGPFGLGLVGEEGQDVMRLAEFGVVMMLFLIGLELQPTLFWQLRGPILGMGGLQVGITTLLIGGIAWLLGLPWQTALAVGMILALSSTAIVLQTLTEKRLMKTDAGQSSFSVLLFQDVAVIPILAVLPLLALHPPGRGAAHEAVSWIEGLPAWTQTLVVSAAVLLVVLIGRFLVRPVFRSIARTRLREIFTAAALMLVVGIALLMTEVGLSPALGTFLAGMVLANSEYRHELESDIEPFKGLLLGLFFIAVGSAIDFGLVMIQPVQVMALLLLLLLVKFLVLCLVGRFFQMGLDQNLRFSFALAQGGEFAFLLFSFAVRDGVVPAEIASPLLVVVALSMAVTPLLMLLNEGWFQPRFGTREVDGREPDFMEESNPVIIAGFGRFGNIVGRFLRANGMTVTVLEYDSDHVDLLRKLGLEVFYGDASRQDLLYAAGADKARMLILAIDDQEKILQIVSTAKRHFPQLTILARAGGRSQAYELIDAGVEHVYRETLDTSLRLAVDALRLLGHRSYQAFRSSRTFRRHEEEAVRELGSIRHDRKSYLTAARQRIQDLEAMLLAEKQERSDERDVGWDTDSLRQEYGRV